MLEIDAEYVADRLPRELTEDEMERLGVLIDDAVELIEVAFLRAGRDFHAELETVPWLESAARRVVLEMVSAATMVGSNAGMRSVSSTTGPQSDSVTFSDVESVSWGGVKLTDELLKLLGLWQRGARGRFPRPRRWPERWSP
ncbi:Gp19/Gp15/Gp42 family protein [Corynebacterium sp. ACRQJ]|uniref:Gp19/Gp15/Gp42 family protein n=1 Tax=Corynebacterium sp. ACRQJ TaxID=2918189 RepID=UPI001EF72A6E|nr:Gp19/Gp15/Gp42 family protein [Corynebacterium sp. ACRQJ]MCG7268252.1 phage Gp19/Gp15/Gp42 family protein [Corynebacterium sp. ACRQJ]